MSHKIKITAVELSVSELDSVAGGFGYGYGFGYLPTTPSTPHSPIKFDLIDKEGFPFGHKKQHESYTHESYESYEHQSE
ncbi:hypothetical protein [Calothrix sp. NIES-3974]|uniref:hypothetical protein n=1 Tax=Calothrix sp. NIES-3974 TaxID=2005462 RepID=UPI000B5E697D|nr:hypothetical protein [Calothrix sp. NIES-3974]BAZ03665.1 hypothetical protein NIES3974_02940 [Calothrix sp. NIES-3974]